jgi:hypothetical protein
MISVFQPIIKRVTDEGQVKRQGFLREMKGESFADLLNFASGFNGFAYTTSVNVLQKTNKEFKVRDVKFQKRNLATYTHYRDVFR